MASPSGQETGRVKAAAQELKEQNQQREAHFKRSLALITGFFALVIVLHVSGIYLFLSGFLLTRLVLEDKSLCSEPPASLSGSFLPGSVDRGCWHPKTFDKAIVIVVDALRYDFTVPFRGETPTDVPRHFHDHLPVLYETSLSQPHRSFLLPFIADPPTATLQRLKGLTTGTLPTFIDAGSNFAGTAIDEDNLISQLHHSGKRIVHLGDDTWHSLFPGYFDAELTRPYDSFNVWDLFTVDNGVNEHLFPLLDSTNSSRWDVIIGHYLGVDHAGHRYGPDHPAMTAKLQEMNAVFTRIIESIDDQTLLVVMGDHGMDAKGDHGGESDDEVEAALWMYSKKGIFGRSHVDFAEPPATAKDRPVRQIDLVPTLSLLLGMAIPFNNLGRPIEEAFLGSKGTDFQNLAEVNRLAGAQIRRYQEAYSAARNLDAAGDSKLQNIWNDANQAWALTESTKKPGIPLWKDAYAKFAAYQQENLNVCRSLWANFDLVSMLHGIELLALTFVLLGLFACGFDSDRSQLVATFLLRGSIGTLAGAGVGYITSNLGGFSPLATTLFFAGICGIGGVGSGYYSSRQKLTIPLPSTFWGWACVVTTSLLCIGFAANSFTIWEDEILLYFLCTFGVLMLASSLRQPDPSDRFLGAWQSIAFIVLTRIASLSRLCREEQMPYCKSTYYASANSSTSAWWQLAIPFVVAALLPSAIRDFFSRSKNYHGSAILWIGFALRIGLVLSALYWIIDAADDNGWIPVVSSTSLKSIRVIIAQIVLAIAFAAGYSTYIWASPSIGIEHGPAEAIVPVAESEIADPSNPTSDIFTSIRTPEPPRPKIIILGYANTHGTRFFLLPTVWALALLLLQKPMGQGTLSLCLLSILNLLEILDCNNLRSSPVGPTVLGLLGSFYFFKTGHQATFASIQWESAFVPLKSIVYPWSPVLIVLNTFAPQILCAIAVPAVVMWKVPPKQDGMLGRVAQALATHILFYAAIALATVVEAAWLRRHLMLYRIFMPRMLIAVVVMLVVEFVGVFLGLGGVRWSMLSVGEVFGW